MSKDNLIIQSITEAFSMQPSTVELHTERYGEPNGFSVKEFKKEIICDSVNAPIIQVVRGYNFEGKIVCEYIRSAINIHYKTD